MFGRRLKTSRKTDPPDQRQVLGPDQIWINPTRKMALVWFSPPLNRCGRFSPSPPVIIVSPKNSEKLLPIFARRTPFRTNCFALYGPDPIHQPDRICWDFSPAPISSSPVPNPEKRYTNLKFYIKSSFKFSFLGNFASGSFNLECGEIWPN